MGKSALLSNGKGSNADKVQDSDTSLLVSNKADKTAKENYPEDSETTPKSCLDVVFELLAHIKNCNDYKQTNKQDNKEINKKATYARLSRLSHTLHPLGIKVRHR